MSYLDPPLVHYKTEDEYYQHFCRVYCSRSNPVMTFDGIRVDFYPNQFKHAFRESADRIQGDKSVFSTLRSQRIDWIKWALENPNAELYQGFDKQKGVVNPLRRVCLIVNNYVVVIQVKGEKAATFITAFNATQATASKIRSNPKWK